MSKNTKHKTRISTICRLAWKRGREFAMAMDDPASSGEWRTLKNGEAKGRHVLLDVHGNIIKGLGGHFNGVNVRNLRTESRRRAAAAGGGKPPKGLELAPAGKGTMAPAANGGRGLTPARRLSNIPAAANAGPLEPMHKVPGAAAANSTPIEQARQTMSGGLKTGKNTAANKPANGPEQQQKPAAPAPAAAPNSPAAAAPPPQNQVNEAQKSAAENAQQAAEIERLKQEIAQLKAPKTEAPKPVQIDTTLPDKIPADTVLQNRSRETEASVRQIEKMARELNYHRVAMSNDFNSGAPVVSYGKIPEKNFGNTETLVTPSGKELQVQYAVMEARDISTSNNAHGERNDAYFSDDPNITRAIAGNGRATAIAKSYASGQAAAGKYKELLAANASKHGCSPEAIAGMNEPVLVRVMQPKDVTKDIGDQTNTTQGLTMNAVEQSRTDAKRMNLGEMKTYDDGSPTVDSVKKFISGLPETEQAGLKTSDGQPTRTAQDRLQNALLMEAFNNDYLVRLRGQAISPAGKNMITALSNSAVDFVSLKGLEGFDISESMALMAAAFASDDPPKSGAAYYWKTDMLATQEQNTVAEMIGRVVANNKNSARKLTTVFKNLAKDLKAAGRDEDLKQHSTDPFGLGDFDDQLDAEKGPDLFGGLGVEDIDDTPTSSNKTQRRVYDTIAKSLERSLNEISTIKFDSAMLSLDSARAFDLGRAYSMGLKTGSAIAPYIAYFEAAV